MKPRPPLRRRRLQEGPLDFEEARSSGSSDDDDDDGRSVGNDDDDSFVEDVVLHPTSAGSSRGQKEQTSLALLRAKAKGQGGGSSGSDDDTGSSSSSDSDQSSDDDDDDDIDDDDDSSSTREDQSKKAGKAQMTDQRPAKKARRDGGYYDDDDDDDDGGSSDAKEQSNTYDDDHSSSSSSSGQDLPLSERIRRKEEQGLSAVLQQSRGRKSKALEVAAERLAAAMQHKHKLPETRSKEEGNSMKRKRGDGNDTVMGEDEATTTAHLTQNRKKKKSKHKPTEVSSKRVDFFRRGAPKLNESGVGVEIGAHRYKPLDPRLSNLTGHFDEEQFQTNYAFLDEVRNREIGQIRKRIAARRTTGDKGRRLRKALGITGGDNGGSGSLEEDEARLKALTQDRAALERSKVERAARQSVKRKIQEEVATGKHGAYYLKRKERKRLEMEAKVEEIRKRGGNKAVEKMLDRKRRRNKSRDAGMFAK
jgi:ribosomal RNA-processing protein 36